MHLFLCFAIAEDKRRPKVTRLLNAHGSRVQKSVFELRVRDAEFGQLQRAISAILKAPDKMHSIPLCGKDLGRRMADGAGQVLYIQDYRIVI